MMDGICARCQCEPIWSIISEAVVQATSLASAGSRLEPERKNSRVKLIKRKVRKMFQADQARAVVRAVWGRRLSRVNPTKATAVQKKRRFNRGDGK